jgi:hypothetical protein
MTPAKRRPATPAAPATPASQGPSRTAPDVPIVANPPPVSPAKEKEGTQLLGPEGEPIAQEAPRRDAGAYSAPPTQTGHVHADDRATTQSRRRPLALYPLPVWPD